MSIVTQLKQSITTRKIMTCTIYVGIPALVFYGLSLEVLTAAGFSLREILRDPAQQSGESSFLGFVSNIGVWLWVSSVAICFFGAIAGNPTNKDGQKELLIFLGLLSLILAIDDFFLLHERYVYQKGIFLFYAICGITLLVRHFKTIMEIDAFPFLLAGFLLATSVEIDINQRKIPMDYAYVQVIEEGFKFIGSAIWLYFCARVAAYRKPFNNENLNL